MKGNEAVKSVLFMALAVLLIGGGLVYWQWGSRSTAAQRVAAIESELLNEEELQNDLQKSQLDLEKYSADLEHMERGVPSIAYVPTLLQELESTGSANNLTVTGVRPVPVTASMAVNQEDKPYRELEIDITGLGTYRSIMSVVDALKTFPKVLAVRTVSVTPRQDLQSNSHELNCSIRLRAYVFKETLDTQTADLGSKFKSQVKTSDGEEGAASEDSHGEGRSEGQPIDPRNPIAPRSGGLQ